MAIYLIASTNPVSVENNVCFLVDLDQLQEPEDLLLDDLGSWNQSKAAVKKYVLTTRKGDNITKITKQPADAEGCYSIYRRPFVNKRDSSLQKTIVNLYIQMEVITSWYFFHITLKEPRSTGSS